MRSLVSLRKSGVAAWSARGAQALVASLALFGTACGEGFDPASELKSLRVLGVHKDKPYPAPGDTVNLSMLWHDAVPEPSSPVQVTWLMKGSEDAPEPPCVNPSGDLYRGCFADFVSGVGFQTGNNFAFSVPADILSRNRPPARPGQPQYGLMYAFFAICAGTLDLAATEQPGALPLACRGADGSLLGPERFIAGYTSLYVFEEGYENEVPAVLDDLQVQGNVVPSDCVGPDCMGPDQPISFDGSDPIVCADEAERCFPSCVDDGDASCPEIKFRPQVRPRLDGAATIAERDQVSVEYFGRDVGEQMWVNYYADRGSFKSGVRLLNDATTGWNDDYGTSFYAPKEPGLVTIWAVVHDNRGGTNWVRTRLRIQ